MDDREEDTTEEDAARKRFQLERNCVEEATGEVNAIFGGSSVLGNDSAPPLAPHRLGIPGGAGVMMTQQDTAFPAEGNAPTAGTAQNLHRMLMGGTPMLHNTGVIVLLR